jgi:methylglutaconyl-CoA hydratase
MDQAIADLASRLAASNSEAMADEMEIFQRALDHWETLLAERAAMSGSWC